MLLPNPDRAVVDIRKLREYCLSTEHPRGRHKARVFAAHLGLTAVDAHDLRAQILAGVLTSAAVETHRDQYGRRYAVDIEVWRGSRVALVRTAWIVRVGEDQARLTSCYVL